MVILTDKEGKALSEFKVHANEFLPNEYMYDTFLLRWLVARDFCVSKAIVMLQNYMEWRKENDIDHILEWEPSLDMQIACPYEITGTDNEGRPVLVFPYGKWTPWDFTDFGRRDEYLKYMNHMLEKCVSSIKHPATQFVIIADSEGFSFRQLTRFKAIEANLEALRGFDAHYPEYMRFAFAINSPKIFSALFALIKPLMSTHTQSKLKIFDSNVQNWKEFFSKIIPQDQLPEKYRLNKENDNIYSSQVDIEFQQTCVDVV